MKSKVTFAVVAAFALILSSCGQKPENPHSRTLFKLADQDCQIVENKSLRTENGTATGEGKFLCPKALRTNSNEFTIHGTFEKGGSLSLIAHSAKEDLSSGLKVTLSVGSDGKATVEVAGKKKTLEVSPLPDTIVIRVLAHGSHTHVEVISGGQEAEIHYDGVVNGDYWGISIESLRGVTIRRAEVKAVDNANPGAHH